jgi:hypothetical protein
MSYRIVEPHIGRFCVDPFKKHKRRIEKNRRDIPAQLLEKWKQDSKCEKILSIAVAVNLFVKYLLDFLKEELPNTKKIIYFSDS